MYDVTTADAMSSGMFAAYMGYLTVAGAAIGILSIVAMWKIFTKAGKPGWASLIPIYNMVVYLNICGYSGWMLLLYFVPVANFVMVILMASRLAKAFGKSTGFAVGLFFFNTIFILILGLGSSEYVGIEA